MSVNVSDEKNELINRIANQEGFQDYNVEIKSGAMKGDGYLGIINTVYIKDATKDLHLIMKSAMGGDKIREHTPVRKAYEREIFMYETIFPKFRQFSEERGILHQFTETAKCYGSILNEKQECLVLENLKEIDFRLWNRKLPMNGDHVARVFATYGKFHGTSLAFKILEQKSFEKFSKNLVHIFHTDDEDEESQKKFEENVKQVFENGLKAVAGNEKAFHVLAQFAKGCKKFFMEDVKTLDKSSCILHGDCWTNNMMFRYKDIKDPTKPTEVCLLDWQLSHIGSPVLDLSYFFYACSSKEVLYDLPKYLKIYHENITIVIKEAGLNPNDVLTYDELELQWKTYSKYGLFMALLLMKLIISESEEAPDLSEFAKSGKGLLESITASDFVNAEEANKRISDIVVFMVEHDYL